MIAEDEPRLVKPGPTETREMSLGGDRNMKALLGVPILAVVLAAVSAETADACWCGAAKFRCCAGCCDTISYCCTKQQCHTVMKTCKEIVYEKQNYTCYKTCYETVCEPRTIDCVKYVPETCYRQCEYTVCRPVWETK